MAAPKQLRAGDARFLEALRTVLQEHVVAPVAPVAPIAPVPLVAPGLTEFSNTVIYKLGSIESLLKEVNTGLVTHVTADALYHGATDDRLGSLERSRSWALAAVAILSTFATIVSNYAVKAFHIFG